MRRRGQRGFAAAFVLIACWVAGLYTAGFVTMHYEDKLEAEVRLTTLRERGRCEKALDDCSCRDRAEIEVIHPSLALDHP